MTGLRWSRRTTTTIAEELAQLDIAVSPNTVARLLHAMGDSLRVNPALLYNRLEPLLADHPNVCLLLECQGVRIQTYQLTVRCDYLVTSENLEGRFLDPLLVVQELTLILREKDLCKLANGCHASRIDEGPDKQWLVDMAHTHLVFEEVNEFFVGHNSLAAIHVNVVPL